MAKNGVWNVHITLTEPMLGTVAKSKQLYADYILSKAPPSQDADDELATVPDEGHGATGFHTLEDGTPIIYDYVIRGFFKDACGMLRRMEGSRSAQLKAYKRIIDGGVFVAPRQIRLGLPEGHPRDADGKPVLEVLERPLRAQTLQGERSSLARSDVAPAGTALHFTVRSLFDVDIETLREWLDYGELRGLGQWRNASYGRFTYTID